MGGGLPQPEGPTSTSVSPSATSKDRSATAAEDAFGNRLVTERKAIIGVSVIVGSGERGWVVLWLGRRASSHPIREGTTRGEGGTSWETWSIASRPGGTRTPAPTTARHRTPRR